MGVNHDGFGSAGGPLAELWNGRTWDTIAVRLPAGATGGALNGVDCLSARDCLAVGFYDTGSAVTDSRTEFGLADTWNGRTWTPATSPASVSGLSGVSCVSARRCVAVGAYTPALSPDTVPAAAEIWNGRTWTQTKPPVPAGSAGGLDAVSCAAVSSCVTTGSVIGGTEVWSTIDSWNGRSWSVSSSGLSLGNVALTGVSCTARDRCAAVGSAYYPEIPGSITELWNGKTWSTRYVPWPAGTSSPTLLGVSCAAANRCVAVGEIDAANGNATNSGTAAVVTWNGKAWTTVNVPAPGPDEASVFNGVTCLTATDCVAVGQVGPTKTTNGTGLSGFWNGKSWRLVTAQ